MLVNCRYDKQAKDADRLEPKGTVAGVGFADYPIVNKKPPAERADLTHPVIYAEHGKPIILLATGKQPRGSLMELWVEE